MRGVLSVTDSESFRGPWHIRAFRGLKQTKLH